MELTGTERLLYGRYRLLTVVGRGGMGVVWQARDELLNRDVAVKELIWPPHFTEADQRGATRRAVREAQLAGRLAHPNVVRIYDILQEDGNPWIVMELLPYPSLHDLVQAEGPLTPARAAQVGLGVLAALRAAHAEGVLHRDVKPANILVGQDGRVVLTDFGIARAVDAPTQTTAGALAGSPSYLAPERASGGHSTPAGDLWGLGASLYQAVKGHPPFERADPLATLTAVVTEDLGEAVHGGPLRPVISGLLRKDPDERLDAAETERMLGEVAGHDATTADPDIAEDAVGKPPVASAALEPTASDVLVRAAADAAEPTAAEMAASASEPAAEPVPAAAAVTSFDQLPPPVPPAAPASRPRRSSRLAGALVALAALAAAVAALVFAVTSWAGHQTALSGGISPSASHPATSPGSSAPGVSATSTGTPSGTAASANPSGSAVPTPASGTASAPASAAPSPAASGSPAGSPSAGSTGDGALPAGYYRFTNSTGFSIGVPDGWQISHVGNYVYITDPSNSGIFLLIDQSDTPKPDPLADWQQQAANRAGTYPDYRLLRLASVSYPQADKAADWEFTYDRNGIPVQILIRNVLANAHHAYALYWSTPETDWNGYYHYFAAFADTFHPAP